MRASDVVARLQQELPKRTALFTNDIQITSLTRVGSTVTAVTAAAHGLVNNQEVVITGAKELNPITSLTFADGVVSATTQNNHDLTMPTAAMIKFENLFEFNYVTVSGANEGDYNGTFLIASAVNRKNFTYVITGTPSSPATGSPALEQESDYNGKYPVTVIDPTTFTYQIATTPISPAGGTIIARSPARISAAVSLDRSVASYTKQGTDKLWAFVVLGNVTTSRDRYILSDATTETSQQNEFRARLLEPFFVYVFIPAVLSYSAREYRDEIENIRGYIYNSLLGVIFPTGLAAATWSQTTPLGDRYVNEASTTAFYIHEFSFERIVDVTYPDTIGPDENRAFRDIELEMQTDVGTGELSADINLDEQPL